MEDLNFAIIIPIYNVKDYLGECLESVFDQDYENLQIICVDDGSNDGSFDIAYEYFLRDKRINIIQKPNGGLSQARNSGLDFLLCRDCIEVDEDNSLSGKWRDYKVFFHSLPFCPDCIHFLDSDDTFEKDCIKECAKLFAQSEVDIVWHDFYFYYQEQNFADRRRVFPFDIGTIPSISLLEMLERMKTKHLNFGWHGAFRAKLVQNIRFVEGIEFEDVSFAFFLFPQASCIALLDKQLICYRVREGSITHSKKVKQYPPYMRDLEGYFESFEEAKFYNFFHSDCINILKSDAFLTQMLKTCKGGGDKRDLELVVKKLREMLDWRTFGFLSIEKHRIDPRRDPRKCKELYRQIRSLGYGGSFFEIVGYRAKRACREFLGFLRFQAGRVKRLIKRVLRF